MFHLLNAELARVNIAEAHRIQRERVRRSLLVRPEPRTEQRHA